MSTSELITLAISLGVIALGIGWILIRLGRG